MFHQQEHINQETLCITQEVSIIQNYVINILYKFKFNFMEMFNKKELDKRIGPLKKEKGLYKL